VLDNMLSPLWVGSCTTGHYPFAFDIDSDGHDELAVGFALFDHQDDLLWNLENTVEDHVDGVAIVDFGEAEPSSPKILYAASDSGLPLVDFNGEILRHHLIGHAQNLVIAKFRDDVPELQAVSIDFWGNHGLLNFYDGSGEIYHSAEPLNMGSMCSPVNWAGSGVELFLHNTNHFHGGMYDGWGRPMVMFPDDGHPDMCCAALDIEGDCRDEIVVWDQNRVWVYTQDDSPKKGRLYNPQRNALINPSNYQASVSVSGWRE
jgi:hypothetical protein